MLRKMWKKISRKRRSRIDGRRKSSGMVVVVVVEEEVVVTPAETKVVVFSAAGRGPPHNFALFAWHPYIYINVLPLILKCRILLTSDAPGIML